MRTSQHPDAWVGCPPRGKMSAKDTPRPSSLVMLLWCGFMYAPRHSFTHRHHKALSELAPRLDLDTQGRTSSVPGAQGTAGGQDLALVP